MPAVLVDSSVLLDVLTEDQYWYDWSSEALARCGQSGPLAINPIIYAEVSIRFSRDGWSARSIAIEHGRSAHASGRCSAG